MKKNNLFICSLVDILDCAEKEKNAILERVFVEFRTSTKSHRS